MAPKPEVSLGLALSVGVSVYAIYQISMPAVADVRVAPPQDGTIEGTRNLATWAAALFVGGVSLLAKDPTIFVVGGAEVIALDWFYRHANAIDGATGKVMTSGMGAAPNPTGGDVVPSMDTMVA